MSFFRFSVIPILADILSDSVKEKVTRIILAVFRVSAYDLLKDVIKVYATHFHTINHVTFIIYWRQYSMLLPLLLKNRPNSTDLCKCNMSCHMYLCYQWIQSSSSSSSTSIDCSKKMCCLVCLLISYSFLIFPVSVHLLLGLASCCSLDIFILFSLRNPVVCL